MLVIRQLLSDWQNLDIHESSPAYRGVSPLLKENAPGYVATQFWPEVELGSVHLGYRCENLEAQTFEDESFDLVITQDVMEHVFHPELAYLEIYRTLRPGGLHIHTTPIDRDLVTTRQRAHIGTDSTIIHDHSPIYHGNPIDGDGSLVTFDWGFDIDKLITRWTDFDVEIRRFNDRTHGIVAEHTDVIICKKLAM